MLSPFEIVVHALKNDLHADPGRIAYFDIGTVLTLEDHLLCCTPAELFALIPAHLIFFTLPTGTNRLRR